MRLIVKTRRQARHLNRTSSSNLRPVIRTRTALVMLALTVGACRPQHQDPVAAPETAPARPAVLIDPGIQAADRIIAETRQRELAARAASDLWKAEQRPPVPEVITMPDPPARSTTSDRPPGSPSFSQKITPPEQMEAKADRTFGPRMAQIAQQLIQGRKQLDAISRQADAACGGFTTGASQGLIFDPFAPGGTSGTDYLATSSSISIDNSTTPLCRLLLSQWVDLARTLRPLRKEVEEMESTAVYAGIYPGVIRQLWSAKYYSR